MEEAVCIPERRCSYYSMSRHRLGVHFPHLSCSDALRSLLPPLRRRHVSPGPRLHLYLFISFLPFILSDIFALGLAAIRFLLRRPLRIERQLVRRQPRRCTTSYPTTCTCSTAIMDPESAKLALRFQLDDIESYPKALPSSTSDATAFSRRRRSKNSAVSS